MKDLSAYQIGQQMNGLTPKMLVQALVWLAENAATKSCPADSDGWGKMDDEICPIHNGARHCQRSPHTISLCWLQAAVGHANDKVVSCQLRPQEDNKHNCR